MTPTSPLRVPCPGCAGLQVVYSCEPRCCFNHVCATCKTTFQTATTPVTGGEGGKLRDLVAPDPPPDSTEPTAECSECKSIAVYNLADGRVVCCRCGTLLTLEYEDIDPG